MNYKYETKDSTYFYNENNRRDGLSASWHPNGQLYGLMYFKDGQWHGERIEWFANGVVSSHEYYIDHVMEIDLKKTRTTDEDKMFMFLKHDAKWLPIEDFQVKRPESKF